jgi:hypothetical protein
MALTLLAQRPSQERSPYESPGCSAVKRVHLTRVVDDRRCMGTCAVCRVASRHSVIWRPSRVWARTPVR